MKALKLFSFLFIFAALSATAFAQEDTLKVTIEGNDQIKFNLEEIKATAGQTVVLTLVHVGKLPETAMGHNWVLLTQGTDINEFGIEASKAQDTDYIPEDTANVIVHTELIGGGEETSIEFTAPEEAGTYDFICSFPGHYTTMQGKFIVE